MMFWDRRGRRGHFGNVGLFYNARGGLMRKRLSQLHQDFLDRQKASGATAGEV